MTLEIFRSICRNLTAPQPSQPHPYRQKQLFGPQASYLWVDSTVAAAVCSAIGYNMRKLIEISIYSRIVFERGPHQGRAT